jgi:hypothetical protein
LKTSARYERQREYVARPGSQGRSRAPIYRIGALVKTCRPGAQNPLLYSNEPVTMFRA